MKPVASFVEVTGLTPAEVEVLETLRSDLAGTLTEHISALRHLVNYAEASGRLELARALMMEQLRRARERAASH